MRRRSLTWSASQILINLKFSMARGRYAVASSNPAIHLFAERKLDGRHTSDLKMEAAHGGMRLDFCEFVNLTRRQGELGDREIARTFQRRQEGFGPFQRRVILFRPLQQGA